MDAATITVRSINTWRKGPEYGRRLARIAEKLQEDRPEGIGLIGLQEITRPLHWPWTRDGASLLAGELSRVYGVPVAACRGGSVGIVAGPEWRLLSHRGWRLGRDSWRNNPWSIPSTRWLLEAEAQHGRSGRRLRFYTAHLSHRDWDRRLEQTRRLIDIVRSRHRNGELRPVVAGDFNAPAGSDVAEMLEEHLELLHDDRVDLVWAGRPASFPNASGSYDMVRRTTVGLQAEGLSDVHEAPGVTLSFEP